MIRKLPSTTNKAAVAASSAFTKKEAKGARLKNSLYPLTFVGLLLFLWWLVCETQMVPAFMLPSPQQVALTLLTEAKVLFGHALISLKEAFLGLGLSIFVSFAVAVCMDRVAFLHKAIYPLIIISQTVPAIAIAPLLVLWLGYGILPKIVLVFITCFFPLVVGWLSGFAAVDQDLIKLFRSMGASPSNILWQVKIPFALDRFFAGLKIAAAYALVGAVIAEWLGGNSGLGVYMIRVRKAYAFDKMFAVIFLISFLSLGLVKGVDLLQTKLMPWKKIS